MCVCASKAGMCPCISSGSLMRLYVFFLYVFFFFFAFFFCRFHVWCLFFFFRTVLARVCVCVCAHAASGQQPVALQS